MKKCLLCGGNVTHGERFGGYCSAECQEKAKPREEEFKKMLRGERSIFGKKQA